MLNYGQGITNKDANDRLRKFLLKYYISKNLKKSIICDLEHISRLIVK